MKKQTLKILIFILLSVNIVPSLRSGQAFAQWQTIYYPDSVYTLPVLMSVYFVDYNNGMASGGGWGCNVGGVIIRTTNSGLTWDTVFCSVDTSFFKQIVFSNANIAFAVGRKGFPPDITGIIARTTDFGNTWDTIITPSELTSVNFPSDSIGYVVGVGGTILKTTDAGNNWFNQNSSISKYLNSVFFLNDTVGYACTDTIILKTTDGGNNWINYNIGGINTNNWPFTKIFFTSDSIGYFLTDNQYIYKTTDSGNNWNLQSTLPSSFEIYSSMFFTNDTTGYIMEWFSMLKTTDGGASWNFQTSTPGGGFGNEEQDVFFLNKDTGFAVGPSMFHKTTNGGECVKPVNFSFIDSLLIVSFYDSSFNSTSWLWNFGDGDTTTLQNPTHTYDSAGIYNVCLTATSICDTVIICDLITVSCPKPISLFGYTDSSLSVSFSDSSTGATSWLWDFGDGDTSTLQNPVHTYDSAMIYNVCLITSNVCGSDTICDSVTLSCPKPISLFGYTDSLLTVSFSDSSTGTTSWLWDFDDGDTDTIQNPTHIYQNPGTYTVILIAGNVCGSDTFMQPVIVNVLGISELVLNDFKLYPNPNNGNFQINYQLSKGQKGELTILDIMGKKLFTYPLVSKKDNLKISKGDVLKNGLYFYQIIINDNIVRREKLLIIK